MSGHQDHQTWVPLDFFKRDNQKCFVHPDKISYLDQLRHRITAACWAVKADIWKGASNGWLSLRRITIKMTSTWNIPDKKEYFLTVPSQWDTLYVTHEHSVRTSQKTAFFRQKDQPVKDVRGKYLLFIVRHAKYMNIQNIQSVKHGGTKVNH